jgi:hypothetical protein
MIAPDQRSLPLLEGKHYVLWASRGVEPLKHVEGEKITFEYRVVSSRLEDDFFVTFVRKQEGGQETKESGSF